MMADVALTVKLQLCYEHTSASCYIRGTGDPSRSLAVSGVADMIPFAGRSRKSPEVVRRPHTAVVYTFSRCNTSAPNSTLDS